MYPIDSSITNRHKHTMKALLLASALFFVATAANAGKALDTEAVQFSFSAGNFSQQKQHIDSKLAGIEYVETTKESREILSSQFALLEGGTVSAEQGLKIQDTINAVLKQSFADSKLVCTFETPPGTNMKKRACFTAAARKRSYERTQRDLAGRRNQTTYSPNN